MNYCGLFLDFCRSWEGESVRVDSDCVRNGLRVLMSIVVPNRTNLATLKFGVVQPRVAVVLHYREIL